MNYIKAKIFGYILGDGWIDIHGNCGIAGDVDGLEAICADIKQEYGENAAKKIVSRTTYSTKYDIEGTTSSCCTSLAFGREMMALGMPKGKRVEQDYELPKWLMEASTEIKRGFISGFYAAEGLIPSLQTNKKTPRPLSMCQYKRYSLKDSAEKLEQQYVQILAELGLTCSSEHHIEMTKEKSLKTVIVINNSETDFLHALQLLDLTYCPAKEERRKNLQIYFELKDQERQRVINLYHCVDVAREKEGLSITQLAKRFGLSRAQISNYFYGKQKFHQVRGFPKFDQAFIDTYCSLKTPLNDENLSIYDFRQATTYQASLQE